MAELMHLFLLSLLFFYSLPGANAVYNIQDYGAKPDGTTDSARSIIRAWAAACGSAQPATIHVPTGNFLVSQASFSGPCKSAAIKFWIEGTIVAPAGYGAIGSSGKWISFSKVDGVSISGGASTAGERLSGVANWPAGVVRLSLTFTNSKNVTIDGLTSINAELFHIVILRCHGVTVNGVNIRAPGNSPNTDGIHVQMSTGVTIAQANIKTGDDCISVGPGTAHLWIERVFCGPGHGISIGSLGKGQGGLPEEGVENVTVKTTIFSGTQNGVRIKTWGTGRPGNVSRVVFENAVMKNVQNPIIIDQNYCPTKKGCPNKSSGIKVSEVKYVGIHGTSATQVAVNFDCSPSNPCSGISLQDIKLSYQNQRAHSYCKHAYGIASGSVVPPSCL